MGKAREGGVLFTVGWALILGGLVATVLTIRAYAIRLGVGTGDPDVPPSRWYPLLILWVMGSGCALGDALVAGNYRPANVLGAVVMFLSIVAGFVIGIRYWASLARYRRRAWRRSVGRCLECGYDLTGNTSGRCPECGAPIKPPHRP